MFYGSTLVLAQVVRIPSQTERESTVYTTGTFAVLRVNSVPAPCSTPALRTIFAIKFVNKFIHARDGSCIDVTTCAGQERDVAAVLVTVDGFGIERLLLLLVGEELAGCRGRGGLQHGAAGVMPAQGQDIRLTPAALQAGVGAAAEHAGRSAGGRITGGVGHSWTLRLGRGLRLCLGVGFNLGLVSGPGWGHRWDSFHACLRLWGTRLVQAGGPSMGDQ